jgi:hypothetical protein
MPPEVAINSMIYPEAWGMDFSYFQESTKLDNFLHKDEILIKLNAARQYLKRFSEFYTEHPPIMEMEYLRAGMKQWWEHARTLNAALEEYFVSIAHFARVGHYEANVLYSQRCREIEKKYAGREDDSKMQVEYQEEMEELKEWREAKLEEADQIEADGFGIGFGSSWKTLKACCEAKFFNDLKTEFFPRVVVIKLNDKYMKQVKELSSLDPDSSKAKALKKSIARTGREIQVLIKAEKEKYSSKWKERYRDAVTGYLPGGLLKDNKFTELMITVRNIFPKERISKACEKCQGIDPHIGLCETLEACEGLAAVKHM